MSPYTHSSCEYRDRLSVNLEFTPLVVVLAVSPQPGSNYTISHPS